MMQKIISLEEFRHIITTKCNFRCLHCYLSAGEEIKEEKLLDEEALKRFYLKYKPKIVSATGGEPLLKEEVVLFIGKVINMYGGALEIVTNGSLITTEFVKHIKEINPKTFYQISLDGFDRYHNYLRDNKNAFKHAMGAISIILKENAKLKVRLTATDENFKDIQPLIDLLDTYDSENIDLVIRPVVNIGRAKENRLSFSRNYTILDGFKSKKIRICTIDNEGKCGCGVNTVAIDPKGDIFPCNYTIGKQKFSMGNIFTEDVDIYENGEFKNFNGTCYARHMQMFG